MVADRREIGNGYWIVKWLVGALWAVFLIIVTNGIASQKDNAKSHEEIRKEFSVGDEKLRDRIDNVDDKVSEDIKKIRADQTTVLVQQTKILTILEQIKKND